MDEMADERTWSVRGSSSIWKPPPGDFKNIPVMLQDKSLITGNYGQPPSPPFFFFPKALFLTLNTFILGEGWGYYLGVDGDHGRWRFTALPFMWSGSLVGSNYRPNDPNWALRWSSWTDWGTIAVPFLSACVHSIVLYTSKQLRVELLGGWVGVCVHTVSTWESHSRTKTKRSRT